VPSGGGWRYGGSTVPPTATPAAGYVFTGWEGDCQGRNSCQLVMDSPKSVKADFAPTQTLKPGIASNGVVGAGLSTPPVTAASPNSMMTIFGTGFAPDGTLRTTGPERQVNGKVATELDGVCVVVGSAKA